MALAVVPFGRLVCARLSDVPDHSRAQALESAAPLEDGAPEEAVEDRRPALQIAERERRHPRRVLVVARRQYLPFQDRDDARVDVDGTVSEALVADRTVVGNRLEIFERVETRRVRVPTIPVPRARSPG